MEFILDIYEEKSILITLQSKTTSNRSQLETVLVNITSEAAEYSEEQGPLKEVTIFVNLNAPLTQKENTIFEHVDVLVIIAVILIILPIVILVVLSFNKKFTQ